MNSYRWITMAKPHGVPQASVRALSASATLSVAWTVAWPAQTSRRMAELPATSSSGNRTTPTNSSNGTSMGHFTASSDRKTAAASAPAWATAPAAAEARMDCSRARTAPEQRRRDRKAGDSATCTSPKSRIPKQSCASSSSSGTAASCSLALPASLSKSDSASSRPCFEDAAKRPQLKALVRVMSPAGPWLCRLSTARISGRE
mmetsp:Transcript_107386/g.299152  ORF Transcript_107386/g.299152 Transcript_107386/m.299152 type:complete len:203 (-) Transcript_107386:1492-2100(-)